MYCKTGSWLTAFAWLWFQTNIYSSSSYSTVYDGGLRLHSKPKSFRHTQHSTPPSFRSCQLHNDLIVAHRRGRCTSFSASSSLRVSSPCLSTCGPQFSPQFSVTPISRDSKRVSSFFVLRSDGGSGDSGTSGVDPLPSEPSAKAGPTFAETEASLIAEEEQIRLDNQGMEDFKKRDKEKVRLILSGL